MAGTSGGMWRLRMIHHRTIAEMWCENHDGADGFGRYCDPGRCFGGDDNDVVVFFCGGWDLPDGDMANSILSRRDFDYQREVYIPLIPNQGPQCHETHERNC